MSTPKPPKDEGEALDSDATVVPSSSLRPNNFRSVLHQFRDIWKRELKGRNTAGGEEQQQQQHSSDAKSDDPKKALSTESELQILAQNLFCKAVELEKHGKVYDALPFYKRAEQIVPDIEFKFYEKQKLNAQNAAIENDVPKKSEKKILKPKDKRREPSPIYLDNLYEKFQHDLRHDYNGQLLQSSRDPKVISTALHISMLPPEIIVYILRWVISSQLDMRSLDQCAAVCKGFYVCARDEDIWQLACLKVWGSNVGLVDPKNTMRLEERKKLCCYLSYREMFIERERVLFSGCYISKTTYLRMGENSFQDQYYRPIQAVEYYRYVRFLADGSVMMLTTPEEPEQGVARLRNANQYRPDILRGHYRLFGNTVTILLKKHQHPPRGGPAQQMTARQRIAASIFALDDYSGTKYCLEFRISGNSRRKYAQLVWLHYSLIQSRNKTDISSEFELTPSKFPPLKFSPVRSYLMEPDAPFS